MGARRGRARRLPKIDPCRVDLKKIRKLSPDALMKVWARLGASRPSRTNANSLLKGIVSNLAAAKLSGRIYADDPKQRIRSQRTYLFVTRRLEREFEALRKKKCRR